MVVLWSTGQKRGHKAALAEDIAGAGVKLLPQRADHLSAIPGGIPL